MSNLAVSNAPEEPNLVFAGEDGRIMTDSRVIAECFEKEHKNVLQSVDNLECSEEFRELNFQLSTYRPENGKRDYKMCQMTRDGLSFLVMGFTGKKAAEWKEKFIAAFNKMESALLKKSEAPDLSNPNHLRLLLLDYSEKVIALENEVEAAKPKVKALERLEGSEGTVTIREAGKILNCPERKFTKFLERIGWAFRQNGVGGLQGYADIRNAGYLEHKSHTYYDEKRGYDRSSIQLLVTPKGVAKLAQKLNEEGKSA